MTPDIYIPQKTLDELSASHPEGSRHAAIIKIAMSLLGNGLSENAVFAEIRGKFPPEKTDKEIRDVIQWCSEKHPTPSVPSRNGNGHIQYVRPAPRAAAPAVAPKKTEPDKMVDWYLNGSTATRESLRAKSPIALTGELPDAILAMQHLYQADDCVNIVLQFTLNDKGKANPMGGGKILPRDGWVTWFTDKGVPQSKAGAWIRMNPCLAEGTGKSGSIKDSDITSYRYLLLESDVLSIERQLALFAVLKLPIVVVISSGAKSVHAWVLINAKTEDEYDAAVLRILTALEPFGFDQSNKNPSRLSRLPGAKREIQAVGAGLQEVLYLNPAPTIVLDEAGLEAFEASLKVPVPESKPFKALIQNARVRYEELYENRGRLGVQVGFREFDRDTGGFKRGQMTVLAAGTNGGKSSMSLNMINGALLRGHGVALFTLEMDREEIVDLLISMNCAVNRNNFNTGYFVDSDVSNIAGHAKRMAELPLWIYDDATLTVKQIEEFLLPLVAENKVGLVVIDYVQIVSPENDMAPREQQVAKIARDIRILAKKTKLPFIVLSQLNDEGKLRESRVVAHEAHNVAILEIDGLSITMKIVKGRRIPKKNYPLKYKPEFCLITDQSPADEPDDRGRAF